MVYIATFFSHYSAIVFSRKMGQKQIPAKMMPIPRKVSSCCGTCVQFDTDQDAYTLADEGVDKIFQFQDNSYQLVFENE